MIQGFCGICGGNPSSAVEVSAVLHDALARSFGRQVVAYDGAGFAAAGAGVQVHRAGESLLMLAGNPRVTRDDVANRASTQGLATVMAGLLESEGASALDCLADHYSLVWVRGGGRPQTLLAIDRMGIGNIHWARQGDQLFFATSLPLLTRLPDVVLERDPQALFNYVYFHMIPAPGSAYKGVARLCPGSHVADDGIRATVGVHARTRFSNELGKADFEVAKRSFRDLLDTGVRNAATGEGEVGSFLSGGTDSSTITGYLGHIQQRPARCFSIGFDQQGFDEIEFARTAVRHFAADQHERYVTPADIVALVPRLAGAYGEPFGNSSVIPAYFCARLAREHGIDVMLGGDGGDELFGGNERYAKQKIFALYDGLPALVRQGLLEPLAQSLNGADAIMPLRKIRRYVEQARVSMPARLQSYNFLNWFGTQNIFDPEFLEQIDPARPDCLASETYDSAQAETMMNRMLALDWKLTLADNDLRKVGTMCEMAGVEARYPLLDERLVDFSAALPIDWKVKGARLRWFFKEALRDFLPAQIINKTKHGFGLPFGSWVVSDPALKELSFDLLGDFRGRQIVRHDFLDSLRDKWILETPNYYGTLVWLFMILESWLAADSSLSNTGARNRFNATISASEEICR